LSQKMGDCGNSSSGEPEAEKKRNVWIIFWKGIRIAKSRGRREKLTGERLGNWGRRMMNVRFEVASRCHLKEEKKNRKQVRVLKKLRILPEPQSRTEKRRTTGKKSLQAKVAKSVEEKMKKKGRTNEVDSNWRNQPKKRKESIRVP